ncbi:MAG: cupin domain-containing protein [Bacteroidales bacterium]
MLIKDINSIPEFTAGDDTILRVILHPDNEPLPVGYSLAHARVKPGKVSYPHTLKSTEVYYILEGEGLMHIDDESSKATPGQAVFIPANSRQYIENTGTGDLVFLCIVNPAWRAEDEVICHPI